MSNRTGPRRPRRNPEDEPGRGAVTFNNFDVPSGEHILSQSFTRETDNTHPGVLRTVESTTIVTSNDGLDEPGETDDEGCTNPSCPGKTDDETGEIFPSFNAFGSPARDRRQIDQTYDDSYRSAASNATYSTNFNARDRRQMEQTYDDSYRTAPSNATYNRPAIINARPNTTYAVRSPNGTYPQRANGTYTTRPNATYARSPVRGNATYTRPNATYNPDATYTVNQSNRTIGMDDPTPIHPYSTWIERPASGMGGNESSFARGITPAMTSSPQRNRTLPGATFVRSGPRPGPTFPQSSALDTPGDVQSSRRVRTVTKQVVTETPSAADIPESDSGFAGGLGKQGCSTPQRRPGMGAQLGVCKQSDSLTANIQNYLDNLEQTERQQINRDLSVFQNARRKLMETTSKAASAQDPGLNINKTN